jgi:mono/diheme cytochrome c family protein
MPEVTKPTTADIHGRLWGTRAREWANSQDGLLRPNYETVLDRAGVARATEIADEAAVAEAHATAIAPYRGPDGSYRIGAVFRCMLARVALVLALATGSLATLGQRADAADKQIERGKYLVTIAGCSDCHTPGALIGEPDMKRYLGGSDVGFAIPGEGVFVPPNLTPDKETGLGNWTGDQVFTALTTGMRPDGRKLAPIMPYQELAYLTRDDVLAIVAFLKSLPVVRHEVPGPFGPNDKPTTLVMAVLPPDVYAALPKPAK